VGGLPERASPHPAGGGGGGGEVAAGPRADDDAEGTTSTRSGSPSTAAAGAAQMLQLAVGRSPVRARRPSRVCLTDASLAAFDLSPPDLDDTATATAVHADELLTTTAAAARTDFTLPSQFGLQT